MFSFDGNFRRSPNISLGGKSKEKFTHSSDVVEKARNERQKRQAARNELRSALILQSSFRSYLVRKKLKSDYRQKFDEECQKELDTSQLQQATKHLCFFFDGNTDSDRLVWLCQKLLRNQGSWEGWSTPYLLSQVLVLCCRSLRFNTTGQIAIPLRMLELYTNSKYWNSSIHNESDHAKSEPFLWKRLIMNDYFLSILHIFEKKLPLDLELPSNTSHYKPPHLVLAESMVQLLNKPLKFMRQIQTEKTLRSTFQNFNEIDDIARTVFRRFSIEILSHQLTCQLYNYILPFIRNNQYFPSDALLDHLVNASIAQEKTTRYKDRLWPSTNLLGSLIKLYDQRPVPVNCENMFRCLQWLVPKLPHIGSNVGYESDDDDDENQSDVAMEDASDDIVSVSDILSDCLQFLNSTYFITYYAKPGLSRQVCVSSLCAIVHHLVANLKLQVHTVKFLYTLAFSSLFLKNVWNSILTLEATTQNNVNSVSSLRSFISGGQMAESSARALVTRLVTLSTLYFHNLLSLHDVDFYHTDSSGNNPNSFQISEIVVMVTTLRDVCLSLLKKILPDNRTRSVNYDVRDMFHHLVLGQPLRYPMEGNTSAVGTESTTFLFKVCSRLLNQLHTRHTRRAFGSGSIWLSEAAMIGRDRSQVLSSNWRKRHLQNDNIAAHMKDPSDEILPMSASEARQLTILTCLPFVVPFETRASIFTTMLTQDRNARESSRDVLYQAAGVSHWSTAIQVRARRDFLYEDALHHLSPENAPDLRRVLRVSFINQAGADEAGYGDGVTREFMQQLVRTAFAPVRGLFLVNGESGLYPNPHADRIIDHSAHHFHFLGRLLGKILYEGMQIELRFAAFFLCKLLRHRNVNVDINHLQSLDPDFYKNLMLLRSSDVDDLYLNFTVVDDSFGETKETELVPGGHDIPVTNDNRVRYIHLLADYKLNKQMKSACDAFREGLSSVVPLEWLRMFDHRELQTLISGAEVAIDVDDMRVNAAYSGGYEAEHPTIKLFWEVLAHFSEEEKRKLLMFVTSCSRPPFLGFKEMHPPFCLHNGGEADRLPTSSTCLNLLRLPRYTDAKTMQEKLLYCIESESGFELS